MTCARTSSAPPRFSKNKTQERKKKKERKGKERKEEILSTHPPHLNTIIALQTSSLMEERERSPMVRLGKSFPEFSQPRKKLTHISSFQNVQKKKKKNVSVHPTQFSHVLKRVHCVKCKKFWVCAVSLALIYSLCRGDFLKGKRS